MHVEWVDDEAVVLDEEDRQLHYLNSSAAYFFALVLEHGYDRALQTLRDGHAGNAELEGDLEALIEVMTDQGLLIDG